MKATLDLLVPQLLAESPSQSQSVTVNKQKLSIHNEQLQKGNFGVVCDADLDFTIVQYCGEPLFSGLIQVPAVNIPLAGPIEMFLRTQKKTNKLSENTFIFEQISTVTGRGSSMFLWP